LILFICQLVSDSSTGRLPSKPAVPGSESDRNRAAQLAEATSNALCARRLPVKKHHA